MSSSEPPRSPRSSRHPPAPFQGALALATYRRGPFICLSGFHEVALGDAPIYDEDDYSSEDSDGPRPASAKAASAATTKQQRKKRKSGGGGEGGAGDEEQQQQQQQPKRRKGKKAAAAAAAAAEASAAAAAAAGAQEEEEEEEPERWVQCDRCLRWRVVPDEHWPGVEADPRPHWFCEWARWDVRGQAPFEAACPQR